MITHNSIGYSGRLGNQMFQYATLKALSLEKGFECFLPDNITIKPDGAYDFTNQKWIQYIAVKKSTINNENETHLEIYF